ncbi:Oligopeptide transport system permease protein [Aromatoleum aromaticum EbN1]|uniref:Oligopeptide transport system permease protein n=1 Tax=Aromatoleum aromaticum (strain DSM 19018 / LMG 30748 / EbN1) TaxID=76114 RepID=Q5NYD6_AROAE|nr:ABC transporter permease [Aromatoleum aromaticum]CAI09928.1 Oligopeptide transport system permease protein [Aromatoleum aromaticum EbN1]
MDFRFVLLWTDALFFVLIALGIVTIVYVRRSQPLRAAWRKVGSRATGMATATILLAFLAIGLADSLHYRPALPAATANGGEAPADSRDAAYSSEVLSALDALLAPLRTRLEKTYSAPFAGELYARETVELPDGEQTRIHPRLTYGAAHLDDPESERAQDIATRLGKGAAAAFGVWLVAAVAVTASLARRRGRGWTEAASALVRGETVLAWRAALVTFGAILLVAGAAIALGSHYHVFGTDKVGQDVLYLSLKSVRTALIIGTLTTLVMLPFAVALGIMAGYLGGWVDDVIQYLYTVLNAIPGVLLIAAAVLMMQVVIDTNPQWFATAAERADARLLALCLILGITSWTGLCRLLRGETLKLRELDYVHAARAFGVGTAAILRRHILPNVMHIVMIALVMDFSGLVLAEAVLSYVGIGVDPGTISFGTMINMARAELAREPMVWWSLLAAFAFMFVLVLSANLFADVVRDAFDPRRG